ncbi:MAG: hypothetical protein HY785_25640 [Oscillatoriophycideae cyanobacterium NC_groundwater_1537_Pr4_S-0.65um_50_18]|nr:hypothetical protein [Oscillatoriophycideae cyanobacterium NC_groundwater_1537_Pr4_S-0.65um_50_18]
MSRKDTKTGTDLRLIYNDRSGNVRLYGNPTLYIRAQSQPDGRNGVAVCNCDLAHLLRVGLPLE